MDAGTGRARVRIKYAQVLVFSRLAKGPALWGSIATFNAATNMWAHPQPAHSDILMLQCIGTETDTSHAPPLEYRL
jgi:hypothetical protein